MENKWNWKALAATIGTFWGIYMFAATILEMYSVKILWFSPEVFRFMASIYPGVDASLAGAFIALFWGLVDGAFCGAVIAGVYNWFSDKFE